MGSGAGGGPVSRLLLRFICVEVLIIEMTLTARQTGQTAKAAGVCDPARGQRATALAGRQANRQGREGHTMNAFFIENSTQCKNIYEF